MSSPSPAPLADDARIFSWAPVPGPAAGGGDTEDPFSLKLDELDRSAGWPLQGDTSDCVAGDGEAAWRAL